MKSCCHSQKGMYRSGSASSLRPAVVVHGMPCAAPAAAGDMGIRAPRPGEAAASSASASWRASPSSTRRSATRCSSRERVSASSVEERSGAAPHPLDRCEGGDHAPTRAGDREPRTTADVSRDGAFMVTVRRSLDWNHGVFIAARATRRAGGVLYAVQLL